MDYRYLKAFQSAAAHLNFTLAAKDLGITQAAVSRQIRLLEESLGMQLLIRTPQSVRLTPEGTRLYQESMRLQTWIDEELQGGTPTIRIAALQGILESWMPPLLAKYFKSSNTNFRNSTGTLDQIDRDLLDGRVDIAITSRPKQTEGFSSFKLIKEKIVIASKKPINPQKLSDYPWITLDPNPYFYRLSKAKSARMIQVESIAASLRLVTQNAGITLIPLHLIPNPQDFHIYPVERFKSEFIWVSTLNYSQAPAYLNSFLHFLRQESANQI